MVGAGVEAGILQKYFLFPAPHLPDYQLRNSKENIYVFRTVALDSACVRPSVLGLGSPALYFLLCCSCCEHFQNFSLHRPHFAFVPGQVVLGDSRANRNKDKFRLHACHETHRQACPGLT